MNYMLDLLDRWSSGNWDGEVWAWVIGIMAVASILYLLEV